MTPTRGQFAPRGRAKADPAADAFLQARETDLAGAWVRKDSDGLQRFLMAHGLDAAAAQAKAESTYCQLWAPKADSSAVPHPPHPPMLTLPTPAGWVHLLELPLLTLVRTQPRLGFAPGRSTGPGQPQPQRTRCVCVCVPDWSCQHACGAADRSCRIPEE